MTTPNADEDTGKLGHIHGWWECKMVQLFWKNSLVVSKKLNMQLPYNLEITILGICLSEMKTYESVQKCS